MAEFRRRLAFIQASFCFARTAIPKPAGFNQSLNRLKRALHRNRPLLGEHRLHPELELLIAHKARAFCVKRAGDHVRPVSEDDVRQAVLEVTLQIQPRRGAPNDHLLRHHVWGLMALFQEKSGKPVLARRYSRDDYSPVPANALAENIICIVQHCDPSIRTARIVQLILEARRTYAGQAMRFRDFFPLYGAPINAETGLPTGGIGGSVERIEWSPPIYCP